MRKAITQVQVIYKVVERCNLTCSYCYYFYAGDQSYKTKPAVTKANVAANIAGFLSKGIEELALESVWIAFHGGEPFLLKPSTLDEICSTFRRELGDKCKLILSAQTNGTHLSQALLDVIDRHDIMVCVSVDGPREAHDRERKDHRGRGSYDIVSKNFKTLAALAKKKERPPVETLAVLDARNGSYLNFMDELNADLGVDMFNFLLPDCCHDDGIPGGFSAKDYGKILCEIVDAWDTSRKYYVREIANILRRFKLAKLRDTSASDAAPTSCSDGQTRRRRNQILTVRSDGEVQIDDTFIPASEWRNSAPKVPVQDISLKNYLELPVFDQIDEIYRATPNACKSCVWRNICNGGDIENRYSTSRGFDNPSVYCDGLKMFYRRMIKFLRVNGYPAEIVRDRLTPAAGKQKYMYAG